MICLCRGHDNSNIENMKINLQYLGTIDMWPYRFRQFSSLELYSVYYFLEFHLDI